MSNYCRFSMIPVSFVTAGQEYFFKPGTHMQKNIYPVNLYLAHRKARGFIFPGHGISLPLVLNGYSLLVTCSLFKLLSQTVLIPPVFRLSKLSAINHAPAAKKTAHRINPARICELYTPLKTFPCGDKGDNTTSQYKEQAFKLIKGYIGCKII